MSETRAPAGDLSSVGLVRGVHGDFLVPHNDLIARQIRSYGAHTRPEIAMVRECLRPGDTVVDVGAHIGTFAVPMAYSVGWAGRVLAVEPNPESFELLEFNVVLNGLDQVISIHDHALSSAEGELLLVPDESVNAGATHLSTEGRSADTDVLVRTVSLDSFLADLDSVPTTVDLIKIDVEGMEEAVIRGATKTIEDQRPIVYFEVALEHAVRFGLPSLGHIDYLIDLGYRMYRNKGERNMASDRYEATPVFDSDIAALVDGEAVADLLAIPAERQSDLLS